MLGSPFSIPAAVGVNQIRLGDAGLGWAWWLKIYVSSWDKGTKPTGLSDCLAAEEEGRRVMMVERGSLAMGPFIEWWETPGRN